MIVKYCKCLGLDPHLNLAGTRERNKQEDIIPMSEFPAGGMALPVVLASAAAMIRCPGVFRPSVRQAACHSKRRPLVYPPQREVPESYNGTKKDEVPGIHVVCLQCAIPVVVSNYSKQWYSHHRYEIRAYSPENKTDCKLLFRCTTSLIN